VPVPHRALIVLLAAALALLAWLPHTQQVADDASRQGLKRALVTYASVRAIDAAVSVAKHTELTVQPAGVGPGFGVGQLLDPLDDLLEQFAALMQWVLVAFGLQTMLAKLGAHWLVSLLLTLSLVGVAALAWRGTPTPRWLMRAAVGLLIVRFAVPAYAVSAEFVHRSVLSDQYVAAQQSLDNTRNGIDASAAPAAAAEPPPRWIDRWLPSWLKDSKVPALPAVDSLAERVERSIERLIDLAVLFLFETVALPLAFFWFLRVVSKAALEPRPDRTAPGRTVAPR
jgi:hypothetical protein